MKVYVALLRGINVGGHKKVPMAELRQLLEGAGFADVKTVLASGNVVFDAAGKPEGLQNNIEHLLQQYFGFEVPVQVIPFSDVQALLKKNPFNGQSTAKGIKWYVTFLGNHKAPSTSELKKASGAVVGSHEGMVFSVLDTNQESSVDLMALLDRQYGKQVTTRTWQTLERIAACR